MIPMSTGFTRRWNCVTGFLACFIHTTPRVTSLAFNLLPPANVVATLQWHAGRFPVIIPH